MGLFSCRKAQVDFRPVSWIPGRTRAAPGLAARSQRGARVLVVPVPASSGVGTLRWVDSLWQLETNETTKSELLSAGFFSWTGSTGRTGSKGGHGTLPLGRSREEWRWEKPGRLCQLLRQLLHQCHRAQCPESRQAPRGTSSIRARLSLQEDEQSSFGVLPP